MFKKTSEGSASKIWGKSFQYIFKNATNQLKLSLKKITFFFAAFLVACRANQNDIKAEHLKLKFLKSSLFQVGNSSRISMLQHFLVRENDEDSNLEDFPTWNNEDFQNFYLHFLLEKNVAFQNRSSFDEIKVNWKTLEHISD